jgi:hypothetical protein
MCALVGRTGLAGAPGLGMAILPAGLDIRRISDPLGSDSGIIFHPRVLPVPDPR